MKKILFVGSLILFMGAGCSQVSSSPSGQEKKIVVNGNIEACGEFPRSTGDGHGGTNRYFVCIEKTTSNCTLLETRVEEKPNCNYDREKYPYGNPDCDISVNTMYSFDKTLVGQNVDESKYNCEMTTQDFYNEKLEK